MSDSVPLLSVQSLTKRFGEFTAVDNVSFDLWPGTSLGIVGESGSGKSTMARMLAGLEDPTAGTITLAGEPMRVDTRKGRVRHAQHIQMIFQDPYGSFDPRLTIAESITEPLRLHQGGSRTAHETRAKELLDHVGLSSRSAGLHPRQLSGGQRQRAAIARALAVDPRILILDEAVAALDVSIQAQIVELLEHLRRDTGIAYLFVSHDLAVVRYVTDTAIVMRHGRIVERGETEHLLRHPEHPYTRLLLDSIPSADWDLEQVAAARRALDHTALQQP